MNGRCGERDELDYGLIEMEREPYVTFFCNIFFIIGDKRLITSFLFEIQKLRPSRNQCTFFDRVIWNISQKRKS